MGLGTCKYWSFITESFDRLASLNTAVFFIQSLQRKLQAGALALPLVKVAFHSWACTRGAQGGCTRGGGDYFYFSNITCANHLDNSFCVSLSVRSFRRKSATWTKNTKNLCGKGCKVAIWKLPSLELLIMVCNQLSPIAPQEKSSHKKCAMCQFEIFLRETLSFCKPSSPGCLMI